MTTHIDAYLNLEEQLQATLNPELQLQGMLNTEYQLIGTLNQQVGDKCFIFVQKVASNTWEINHNMNKFPSVTVVDTANSVVIGDVRYIDQNNLVILFSAGFKGAAYLN